jgi:hypothetical protein
MIPLTFTPTTLGLLPGMLRFTTNDPDRATVNQGVVGTGIPTGGLAPPTSTGAATSRCWRMAAESAAS